MDCKQRKNNPEVQIMQPRVCYLIKNPIKNPMKIPIKNLMQGTSRCAMKMANEEAE